MQAFSELRICLEKAPIYALHLPLNETRLRFQVKLNYSGKTLN